MATMAKRASLTPPPNSDRLEATRASETRVGRETEAEKLFKRERGLGDHVRVALGNRPKQTVPVPLGQSEGPRGLGDLIARWTSSVGLKPCAKCRRRQRALNRRFPFPRRAQG